MLNMHTATEQSEFLYHEPCPDCGSSDARAVYSNDGGTYCFSCQKSTNAKTKGKATMPSDLVEYGEAISLPRRNLHEQTCKKYDYTVSNYRNQPVQVAHYRDPSGKVVAQKIRGANKTFSFIGNTKNIQLFGQHLWKPNDRMTLVICEGEIDTLSMAQANQLKFPVVGIPNGCAGASKAIARNLEFVEGFKRVVIMFDDDASGRSASLEVAQLLSPSKAHIAKLPLKDVNDMLVANRQKDLIQAMWEAQPYRPDGIIAGSELWDDIISDNDAETIEYPWDGLNIKTHAMRRGELVTLCAGSGVGKSQVCKEIAYSLMQKGKTVGYIALEENTTRTALGLMGIDIGKPLHINKEGVSEDELRNSFINTVGNGRVFLYDHFGSLHSDNLISKIRYLAKGCGVEWVILDHLSIVVSQIADGDERRLIDNTMTALRSLVEETGIGLLLVSHLRRPQGDKGWEEGLQTSLNSLRGSAAIAQLSDICLGIERNQQGDHPHVSTIRILKNRFSGETGIGCYLQYNPDTGRMLEVDNPEPVFEDESSDF